MTEKRTLHLTCRRCGKPFTRQAQITISNTLHGSVYGWMGDVLDIRAQSHDHAASVIRFIKKAATCDPCKRKSRTNSNLQPVQAPARSKRGWVAG